jgi:uncharacterized protein GlcG (DUF336 family)
VYILKIVWMDGALRHALPKSAQLHSVFTHQQELEVMSDLTLSVALKIIDGAVAKARSAKYKPMGIAVLDASGHLVAYAREDGASMFRFEIAQAKAWGAVGMGVSSRVSLAATAAGKFLPQTGAVLIKNPAGEVIGAAGASGGTGEEDEEICTHGIQSAGLVAA